MAQSSNIAVSAGYQILHIPDETFPLGFNIDVSRANPGLTFVGELGWAQDTQNEPGVGGTLNFINYGAGPRWNGAGTGARPFVQVIAGGVHTRARLKLNSGSFSDSDDAFMLQPGAGVFVPLGPKWGVVGQGDYRHVFFKEEGDNEWRFVLGVRFGGR